MVFEHTQDDGVKFRLIKYTAKTHFMPNFPVKAALVACLLLFFSFFCRAQKITTVAGGIGNDSIATVYGRLCLPNYVVADGTGAIYIGDNYPGSSVRKVDLATNRITPVKYGGKGVIDGAGTWYYISGKMVYKRTSGGIITHIAGDGGYMYDGDGGAATAAAIDPTDVGVDGAGNVYICDNYNCRIRKVNTAGSISTVAGTGESGSATGNGGPAVLAKIDHPENIAVDASGTFYFSVFWGVRKVDASGIITAFAGGSGSMAEGVPATSVSIGPVALRLDVAGNLLVVTYSASKVVRITPAGTIYTFAGISNVNTYSGDGGPATAAQFNSPNSISVGAGGKVYICDKSNYRIREVNSSGVVTTVAGNGMLFYGNTGDGGIATLAQFNTLGGAAMDASRNLFLTDYTNHVVRKITPAGIVSTIAGVGIAGFFGDGGPATSAALHSPKGVACDRFGNVFVGEYGSNHVRKISPSGIISTIAGGGPGGLGDGGPATNAMITVNGIATDNSGNVYIADYGNNRIRKVDGTTGIITTIAGNGAASAAGDGGPATDASLSGVYGVFVDNRRGNIFVSGNTNRKIDNTGTITTIPGSGTGIAVDTMGNVYLGSGNTVQRVDIYNYLSVIAGTGVLGYSGDNGPAKLAEMGNPVGLVADSLGNLYAAMGTFHSVRKIWPLPTIIDRPPLFAKGSAATLNTCVSPGSIAIDTFFKISDGDVGQTETWTVISGPTHGTLSGFPYTTTSTGGSITPSGITYTPVTGYSGSDNFRIKISDGEDTAAITISVVISPPPTVSAISGASMVCEAASITLSSTPAGGTWTASNASATIGPTGIVSGITPGVDTITYSRVTTCGSVSTTKVITVNPLPFAQIDTTTRSVCVTSSVVLSGVFAGGVWNSSSPYVAVGSSTGTIVGLAPGTALISYTFNNSCGTARDTITMTVQPAVSAGTISGGMIACVGGGTALTSTVPGGTWTSSAPIIATVSSAGIVTGGSAGATFISYTVANSCGSAVAVALVNIVSSITVAPLSGASSVCAGSTISISHPLSGGTWSSSNATIASVGSTGIVTGVSPGAATISYSLSLGCGISLATMNVLVHSPAVAGTISGPTAICTGVTNVMTATAPGGVWSSSNGNAAISPAGIISGVTPGTSMLTYTVSNSCGSDFATHLISVYPSPVAGTVIGGSAMCVGTSASYTNPTATPSGAWSSSNPAVAAVNATGLLTGVSVGTTIISYTVATGCSIVSAYRTVTVNATSAGTITGVAYLCAGGVSTLTSTVSGGTWTSSSPSVATVSASGVVNALAGGNSVISYSKVGVCGVAHTTLNFTVGSLPVVSPITGLSAVCVGGGGTLLNSSTVGGVWSSSDMSVASIGSSGYVSPSGVGTATISYSVTAGCGTSVVTMIFAVNGPPAAAVLSGASSLCASASATLSASIPGGTWTSGNPFVAAVSISGIVTGLTSGTAIISYTLSNACGGSVALKTTNVLVPDAGVITGVSTICVGNGSLLSSSVPGGTWSSSTPSVADISASGVLHGFSAGSSIVSYDVTDACGHAVATIPVTVSALPLVDLIGGADRLCAGTTAILTNATIGGSWLSSDVSVATVDGAGNLSAIAVGTCTISYLVTGGCGTTGVVKEVVVEGMPEAGDINGSETLCVASQAQMLAGAASGIWTSNAPFVADVDNGGFVSAFKPGAATIFFIASNTCGSDTARKQVSVIDKLPPAVITGKLNVCVGQMIPLTASEAGGVWSCGSNIAAVDASGQVSGISEGATVISYTISNYCGATVATSNVNINPGPVVPAVSGKSLVIVGKEMLLANTVPGGIWRVQDSTIANIDNAGIVSALYPGVTDVTYSVVNANGCYSTVSHPVTVAAKGLVVYGVFPNPASGALTISWSNSAADAADVMLTDMLGRTVFRALLPLRTTNGTSAIDLSLLSDGVYHLSVLADDGSYQGKIVIKH